MAASAREMELEADIKCVEKMGTNFSKAGIL